MANPMEEKKVDYIIKIFETLVKVLHSSYGGNTLLTQILSQTVSIKNNTNYIILTKDTGVLFGSGTLNIPDLKAIIIQNTGSSDIYVEGLVIKPNESITITAGGIRNILPPIDYDCGSGFANYYALI